VGKVTKTFPLAGDGRVNGPREEGKLRTVQLTQKESSTFQTNQISGEIGELPFEGKKEKRKGALGKD